MKPTDQSVEGSLSEAEMALGLVFDASAPSSSEPTADCGVDALNARLQIHVLAISVLYYTLIGQSAAASPRLSRLHRLLDVLASAKGEDAYITVCDR